MINLKKQAKPTFAELQKWYDQANWSGEVKTHFGTLTAWGVRYLQEEHYPKQELEYNCPA